MARHIVAAVDEIPPGGRKLVEADGKKIVVFNLGGEFFALLDRCPHQGSALSGGILCGLTVSDEPGRYHFSRAGEMVRCPWHNWEFDIRTGKSWFDPRRTKVRAFPAHVEPGAALASDPRRAHARSGESAAQENLSDPRRAHARSGESAAQENLSDPRRAHARSGESAAQENLSDPRRAHARSGESAAEKDAASPSMPMDGGVVEGPYQAETFPVKVEADYVVVEV